MESPAVGSGRSLPVTSGSREARLNKMQALHGTEFIYLLRWMVQWSNGGQNLISKLGGAVAVQNFYLDFQG